MLAMRVGHVTRYLLSIFVGVRDPPHVCEVAIHRSQDSRYLMLTLPAWTMAESRLRATISYWDNQSHDCPNIGSLQRQ